MKQFLTFFILLIFCLSCSSIGSNRGHNRVQQSEVSFRGGMKDQTEWKESLNFMRTSWFYGVLMYYDTFLVSVDKDSPFTQWFSESEKQIVESCSDFVVAILYNYFSQNITHRTFSEQMLKNNYEEVFITEFAHHLQNHHQYYNWRLNRQHIIQGYCYRGPFKPNPHELIINFPNFRESKITLGQ